MCSEISHCGDRMGGQIKLNSNSVGLHVMLGELDCYCKFSDA